MTLGLIVKEQYCPHLPILLRPIPQDQEEKQMAQEGHGFLLLRASCR
jgi:hypothetical protein